MILVKPSIYRLSLSTQYQTISNDNWKCLIRDACYSFNMLSNDSSSYWYHTPPSVPKYEFNHKGRKMSQVGLIYVIHRCTKMRVIVNKELPHTNVVDPLSCSQILIHNIIFIDMRSIRNKGVSLEWCRCIMLLLKFQSPPSAHQIHG